MQQDYNTPECNFCHAKELEFLLNKESGLLVQCPECGYSRVALNSDIASEANYFTCGVIRNPGSIPSRIDNEPL